jgi:hypothetical protein
MMEGRKFSFDEETALLYDAVTPHHDRAYYMALVAQVDKLLPGEGSLPERLKAFRAKFAIPKDKLKPVFDASIAACRERTAAFMALPQKESFVLEFVTNKPWSGYNWYKGNADQYRIPDLHRARCGPWVPRGLSGPPRLQRLAGTVAGQAAQLGRVQRVPTVFADVADRRGQRELWHRNGLHR